MEYYSLIKLLHILSSTLLLGTGLGTAFYMWRADKSGELQQIATTSKNVVLADWVFTTPAVIVQPLSGLAMVYLAGIPLTTHWLLWSILLYIFVGMLWLPVVWIQLNVARHAQAALEHGTALVSSHKKFMRWWYGLGWPAFIAVIAIFYMMVVKPQ